MAELEGFKELSKQLSELGPRLGGNALRAAAMAAMLPVMKEAKARAPRGDSAHKTYKGRLVAPGFGARQIRRRSKLSRDRTSATARVGVRPEAYYMVNFVELGTSEQAAQPWLKPAMKAKRNEAIKILGERLKKRIDAVAR